jgi:galactose mutarotase-like enzyme
MTRLSETTWYSQPAWALESDELRVITVPGMGAKIVSIFNKVADYEWLLGPADRPFKPVDYGASFVDQDMSGWDEMFPTINACHYPLDGPYKNAALPDHGEVWALPWERVEAAPAALAFQVSGRALPYRLTRTMSLPDAQTLRLDYAVENTGDVQLAGLWAAHPQFTAPPATAIRLPDSTDTVIAVQPLGDWCPVGTRLQWPVATAPEDQRIRLDRVTSAQAQTSRKVYLPPDDPVSWARLIETDANHWLHMAWDVSRVPYLGIWVDEGRYNPALTIAFEPSTGFYDDLSLASEKGRVPSLAPGDTSEWSITVQVGAG